MGNCRISNDWPERLATFIEAKRHQPFQWGVNDCCLFASDWIRQCTGWDPAGPDGWDLRGRYDTALGATRVLALLALDPPALADRALLGHGWATYPPRLAPRGSICAVCTPDHGYALGVVAYPRSVFAGPHGIEFIPRKFLTHSWRLS